MWHFKICITSLLLNAIVGHFHRSFYTLGKFLCCNWDCSTRQNDATVYEGLESVCHQNTLLFWRISSVAMERKFHWIMFHHWVRLSTRMLNRLKEQEMCVMKMRRNMHNRLGSQPALHAKSVMMTCQFLYKMQLRQPLSEDGIAKPLLLCVCVCVSVRERERWSAKC